MRRYSLCAPLIICAFAGLYESGVKGGLGGGGTFAAYAALLSLGLSFPAKLWEVGYGED